MAIAAVLAVITGDEESEPTLRTAVSVGQAFDAYLEALHVRADPESIIPVVAAGMSTQSVHILLEGAKSSTQALAEDAHRLFQNLALDLSLPLTTVEAEPQVGRFSVAWHEVEGSESHEVARRGRLFDLSVLSRPHDGYDETTSVALSAALFETGRPVLVAPPVAPNTLGQRVMIAWNDSREAAESAWAVLPFAAKAAEVTVTTVAERKSAARPEDLARALARHGIAAASRTVDRGKMSVGECLLAEAKRSSCDLLAMGAYGHGRLQEYVLGGATRHVLKHARIPLLLAH